MFLGRSLEVDVCGIHQRRKFRDDILAGAAVRDEDIAHAPGPDFPCAIAHELPSDKRFVVGIGESEIALFVPEPHREVGQFGRRRRPPRHLIRAMLRNGVVLAEWTAQVASA